MKIVQINSVVYGSTGKIMRSIAETVKCNGGEAYTFSENRGKTNIPDGHRFFGYFVENILHRGFSMITGISGVGSAMGTYSLIREIDAISPDILQLHNLHGWYINLPMLFNYIKKKKIRVVWTLHDCWAFTAQCSHFTMEKCEKWKTGCHHCSRYRIYPNTYVDRTKTMWKRKKAWFTGVENMTIVTPSQWLADLVKESFLKDYPVKVIHNGIDLSVYKPIASNFREKHGIAASKQVVLGVAASWGIRKGLDVFLELEQRLDKEQYQIVLVGTDEKVDRQLPPDIISIHRTQNQQELAEIYTAADVFVNPTREEVLGLVNLEALACGTPVITFNTGGSPECIDTSCGFAVECDNIDEMESVIIRVGKEKPYSDIACITRAEKYHNGHCFGEYDSLYSAVIHR